jgi:putative permease
LEEQRSRFLRARTVSSPSSSKERVLPITRQELEIALFRALRKAIVLVVGLYVLFQFLESITFIVLLFSLVFLFAAVLNPLVAWLQRHRIPRSVSAAALGLLMLGGMAAALWFGVPPLLDQGQQLWRDAPELWDGLRRRAMAFLSSRPELAAQIPDANELVRRLSPVATRLVGQLGRYTASLLTVLGSSLLLVVLVVYSLASPQPLIAGLLGAVPERHRHRAEHILSLTLTRLKSWAMGSLLLGLIVGTACWIGLHFLGVPFALVFGVIAGIGELLPNLGPVISAVPPMLVALSVDPMLAVWVALLFLVVQQLENNLIVPLVMSRTLDLHPLSVTFMVLTMGTMFGVVGAIIAVPAAVVIKTLYQELYLSNQVSDPRTLEEQSERVVSDEAAEEAEEETAEAPMSSARRSEAT